MDSEGFPPPWVSLTSSVLADVPTEAVNLRNGSRARRDGVAGPVMLSPEHRRGDTRSGACKALTERIEETPPRSAVAQRVSRSGCI